jgi:uncharacterized phage-associated protein
MLTSYDVSSYFLALNDQEAGEDLTNLKLQKLCYYAQGFYLALYDIPLFADPIEAWQHGPVIPNLYHQYKNHGNKAIVTKKIDLSKFSKELQEFLNEVYETYGQFSAWKLREMTHQETPWIQAYEKSDSVISHESMKTYFKTLTISP